MSQEAGRSAVLVALAANVSVAIAKGAALRMLGLSIDVSAFEARAVRDPRSVTRTCAGA